MDEQTEEKNECQFDETDSEEDTTFCCYGAEDSGAYSESCYVPVDDCCCCCC